MFPLRVDLFCHHACPAECKVFLVAVDEVLVICIVICMKQDNTGRLTRWVQRC